MNITQDEHLYPSSKALADDADYSYSGRKQAILLQALTCQ